MVWGDRCYHVRGPHQHAVLHDDVIKWKHFPRYWPFVRGIHRPPVNSPHEAQWRGALMFSLICVWKNGWVNNREAGDLKRYRAHYDVTVMDWHTADWWRQPFMNITLIISFTKCPIYIFKARILPEPRGEIISILRVIRYPEIETTNHKFQTHFHSKLSFVIVIWWWYHTWLLKVPVVKTIQYACYVALVYNILKLALTCVSKIGHHWLS